MRPGTKKSRKNPCMMPTGMSILRRAIVATLDRVKTEEDAV